MLRAFPIFALTLAACGGGYQADSFQTGMLWGGERFEGTRLSHGCLDIALRAQEQFEGDPQLFGLDDRAAPVFFGVNQEHRHVDLADVFDWRVIGVDVDVFDVGIGNRCPEALHVNLGKLRIRGHFDGEAPKRLTLFDPNDEIGNALLGGKAAASERLEVFGAHGAYELCVSVDAIVAARNSGPPNETCILVEPAVAGQS